MRSGNSAGSGGVAGMGGGSSPLERPANELVTRAFLLFVVKLTARSGLVQAGGSQIYRGVASCNPPAGSPPPKLYSKALSMVPKRVNAARQKRPTEQHFLKS